MPETATYDVRKTLEDFSGYSTEDMVQWMYEAAHPSVVNMTTALHYAKPKGHTTEVSANRIEMSLSSPGWNARVKIAIRYNPKVNWIQEYKTFKVQSPDFNVAVCTCFYEYSKWKQDSRFWADIYPDPTGLGDNIVSILFDKDGTMVSRWEMKA